MSAPCLSRHGETATAPAGVSLAFLLFQRTNAPLYREYGIFLVTLSANSPFARLTARPAPSHINHLFFQPASCSHPLQPRRSKRGCNGGTPCEQCIRRGQDCTYSQRRKSGPRGRPLRPQQVISAGGGGGGGGGVGGGGTPPVVGTRTSSRRRIKRTPSFHDDDDDDEEEDRVSVGPVASPVSPESSPSRTVSLPSTASSSDEAVTDNDSDTAEEEQQQEQQKQQKGKQERRKNKKQPSREHQVHKRSKISRPSEAGEEATCANDSSKPSPLLFPHQDDNKGVDDNVARVPPCSLVANKARPRGGSIQQEQEKNAAVGEEPVPPVSPSLSSTTTSCSSSGSASSCLSMDEGASYASESKMVVDSPNSNKKEASAPREPSPMTVGAAPHSPPLLQLERSSSLPTWARDGSSDAHQQQQQQPAPIASVGAVPISGRNGSCSTDGSNNSEIREAVLQPSEIPSSPPPESSPLPPSPFDLPRSVTLVHTSQQRQQLHQQAQAHQAPVFAVKSSSGRTSRTSTSSGNKVFASKEPQAGDPMGVALPQQQQQHATSLAAASMMLDDGSGFGGGGLKEWQEDDDLECCPWQIPSLTREMSLARVVAGLGGEQSTFLSQGVGFEGSFISPSGW